MTGRFAVEAVEMDDHWVVSVSGEVDAVTVSSLGECLHKLARRGSARFIVDVARVRIVEFTGAEALIATFRRLRHQGTQVALRPSGGAYQVLHRIDSYREAT